MKRVLFAVAVCSALAPAPCSAGEKLAVVGTGDGVQVLTALAAAFMSENPEIRIDLPPSVHSAGGIKAVAQDDAIVGRIARPLNQNELGLGLRVIPIFYQPTVFFAHPSANVKNLTADQLVAVFSGTVKNWSEVGGSDVRVRVVRREEPDSSVAVFRDTLPGWKELKFDKGHSKLATTTQEAFDAVEKYEGAIGFGPYSRDLDRRFTVLSVDGVHPTDSNYPSTVTLSLIYRDATVTDSARKFIDFNFTEKAQDIVRRLGAIPVEVKRELSAERR
ncbi:MAG TPA: substrate-binding domain-containing protein [Xanthobacteraceae bacterium]|nr:substrate-binding domain-containing protein [Xanthobacteraceae bacterium]